MEMSGFVYTCSAGETFDSMARDVYGDERYACNVMCANPEYSTTLVFSGGEMLYLPVVEIVKAEEAALPQSAPWRE